MIEGISGTIVPAISNTESLTGIFNFCESYISIVMHDQNADEENINSAS